MTLASIPALRAGRPYESLDRAEIPSIRSGEPCVRIGQVNAGIIKRDLRRAATNPLGSIPVKRLCDMSREAGKRFLEGDLPLGESSQSPRDYIEQVSQTTGLPHALVRRNMGKVGEVFARMEDILRGLTRGLDWRAIDEGLGEQNGVPVCYYRAAETLGIVLPSNSPGVNSLWMPSIALKVPVILKPGREEPWTPYRIVQAFVSAGVPAEAFAFYPTDHEGSAAVLESCDRALVFGDQSTVERYAGNPNVQAHGPGWSKVLIGEDQIERWPEFVDVIVQSISENGGRSCINASCVVVPRYSGEIAEAVARKLAQIEPRAPEDPAAVLAGFANPKMADFIDGAIEEGLITPGAEEATARFRQGGRRVERDGCTYLLPTLVRCGSFEHPLANREFLFPYASVVEVAEDQMLEVIGPSLVVTAITRNDAFAKRLLACRHVDRLNLGPLPTTRVQWDQPHEGNLFEFLYKRRAIQCSPDIPVRDSM